MGSCVGTVLGLQLEGRGDCHLALVMTVAQYWHKLKEEPQGLGHMSPQFWRWEPSVPRRLTVEETRETVRDAADHLFRQV